MANIYKLACRETLSKFYRVTYSFPTVGNTFFSYRLVLIIQAHYKSSAKFFGYFQN